MAVVYLNGGMATTLLPKTDILYVHCLFSSYDTKIVRG